MIGEAIDRKDMEIHTWIVNMEEATGKKYSGESAEGEKTNERDENGVKDQWWSIGAPGMEWENAEERGDIAGWLGDAVYMGKKGVSFGQDDYIADPENISYMLEKLKNNPNYKETYEFLNKLKTCLEGR